MALEKERKANQRSDNVLMSLMVIVGLAVLLFLLNLFHSSSTDGSRPQ